MNKTIAFAVMAACAGAFTVASAQTVGIYATKADERAGILTQVDASTIQAGGDNCATPTAIAATPFNDTGTTVGSTNTYAAHPDTVCTGYTSSAGPDHIYSVQLGAANNVTFTVQAVADYDQAIFLLSTCGDNTTCVVGADASFTPDTDMIETFNVSGAAPGTYFFYIDSFYPVGDTRGEGPYTLDVTGTLPVELLEFSAE